MKRRRASPKTKQQALTSVLFLLAAVVISGCRESSSAPSPNSDATASTQSAGGAKGAFPTEVAGLKFGLSRKDVEKICTDSGIEARLHEREGGSAGKIPAITCAGLPKPPPLGEFAYFEGLFCEDHLCVVKLGGYDGSRYEPLRAAITDRYGPLRADYSRVPDECAGAALPACLQNQKAQKLLIWTWTEGFPARITAMVRLTHAASAQGEYVFLFFCDAAGSDLIAATTR